MSFAEKGSVSEIETAFFIGHLHRGQATGTLKFEDAPIQRAIYFREGRVLFSSSNAPEDQLGAILIAGGKITQEQFDAIIAGLEPKQSIAAALAQGGHVSQRDIGDAARRKVEQIVGACCVQTRGRYEFEEGVLPRGALDLKLTTERVLVAAFEVLEPSGFLIRILKSPMAVLAPGEVATADPDLLPLHQALDGVSSLADLSGKVGLPQAATEARAAVLVVLGAASVVTSQIEDMELPDTGEELPDLAAAPVSFDLESVEAETIGFAPAATENKPSAPESGAAIGGDATLVMSAEEAPAFDPQAESTLIMGSDFSLPAPATPDESGSIRGGAFKRERTSTADLAAIKELISSPPDAAVFREDGSASRRDWGPVSIERPVEGGESEEQPEAAPGLLKNPLFQKVAAGVLFALVAVAGWFAYTQQSGSATRTAISVPAATPASARPSGTIVPFEPPPSANTIPGAPGGEIRPASATAPTPGPAPVATGNSGTGTAAPTAPAAGKAPAVGASGAGYEALKAGRLAEAEAAFRKAAESKRAEFSLQLLVACSPQTIEKAILNDPSPDLFVLAVTYSGKPCHRLMRGYFKTSDQASQATAALPPYYVAEGAKPKAVAISAVLQ